MSHVANRDCKSFLFLFLFFHFEVLQVSHENNSEASMSSYQDKICIKGASLQLSDRRHRFC